MKLNFFDVGRIHPSPCPHCGCVLDGFRGERERPQPGDLTICSNCLKMIIYDDGLSLRSLTEAELQELQADQELWEKLTQLVTMVKLMRQTQLRRKSKLN